MLARQPGQQGQSQQVGLLFPETYPDTKRE